MSDWQPSARYPDPAVHVVDESFARYKLNLAKVERLATGFRWAEGPVWFGDVRCLFWSDIPNNRIMRWDEEMGAAMSFPRDAGIYRENSPATYLYKVISGTVRTFKALSNGRRQIRAFYLPGDIFGVETGPEHAFSAEAITDAKVFVIERK